jgi:hypothetical protein
MFPWLEEARYIPNVPHHTNSINTQIFDTKIGLRTSKEGMKSQS